MIYVEAILRLKVVIVLAVARSSQSALVVKTTASFSLLHCTSKRKLLIWRSKLTWGFVFFDSCKTTLLPHGIAGDFAQTFEFVSTLNELAVSLNIATSKSNRPYVGVYLMRSPQRISISLRISRVWLTSFHEFETIGIFTMLMKTLTIEINGANRTRQVFEPVPLDCIVMRLTPAARSFW